MYDKIHYNKTIKIKKLKKKNLPGNDSGKEHAC